MIKVLYRPLSIVVSILGGLVAGALFKQVWKRVAHEEDPPKPTEPERSWKEVGAVKAAVDRGSLKAFEKATGVWAGD
jgi:hypothetical protein